MWEVTNSGLKLKDTTELLAEVQAVFTDIWPDINLDPSTPQGQIITKITDMMAQAQSSAIDIANVLFQGGSGAWLDIRNSSLFGLSRRPPTYNTIDIRIVGTPYYTIPAGLEVSDADGSYTFTLENATTIPENGILTVSFINKNDDMSGAVISLGTINKLLAANDNIESVTNSSYLFRASPQETDGEYLQRAEASKYYRSISVTSAGLAYVRQTDGVTRAVVYENYGNAEEMYKDTLMPPHSVSYAVEGGDIYNVASAILARKNPGCAFGGDNEVAVMDSVSGQIYRVKLYRTEYTQLHLTVIIKRQLTDNLNYTDQIFEGLKAYVDALPIGEDIYATNIVTALKPNFLLRELLVYDSAERLGEGLMITARFNQCFQANKDNIQVTLA